LHSEGVVHGDIKPVSAHAQCLRGMPDSSCDTLQANILVDKRGVMIRAVLTDFGLSRILETSGFTTTTMKTPGTLRYMARELIDPMTIESTPKVTEESDIWSVAMTSLEVCL
jgi:serine/threonine protein kinase